MNFLLQKSSKSQKNNLFIINSTKFAEFRKGKALEKSCLNIKVSICQS